MRRDFQLPSEDERFLARFGFPWETVLQGSERWVLMHEHPLPDGYDHRRVIIAILLSGGYPESPLDMVYLYPAVARTDGVALPATEVRQLIDGKSFQRWSRHRTGDNPWRPGEDNLETHYDLMCDALRREFSERARR